MEEEIEQKNDQKKNNGFTQEVLSFSEKVLAALYSKVAYMPNHIRAFTLMEYQYY
jgi:hypothetical protein